MDIELDGDSFSELVKHVGALTLVDGPRRVSHMRTVCRAFRDAIDARVVEMVLRAARAAPGGSARSDAVEVLYKQGFCANALKHVSRLSGFANVQSPWRAFGFLAGKRCMVCDTPFSGCITEGFGVYAHPACVHQRTVSTVYLRRPFSARARERLGDVCAASDVQKLHTHTWLDQALVERELPCIHRSGYAGGSHGYGAYDYSQVYAEPNPMMATRATLCGMLREAEGRGDPRAVAAEVAGVLDGLVTKVVARGERRALSAAVSEWLAGQKRPPMAPSFQAWVEQTAAALGVDTYAVGSARADILTLHTYLRTGIGSPPTLAAAKRAITCIAKNGLASPPPLDDRRQSALVARMASVLPVALNLAQRATSAAWTPERLLCVHREWRAEASDYWAELLRPKNKTASCAAAYAAKLIGVHEAHEAAKAAVRAATGGTMPRRVLSEMNAHARAALASAAGDAVDTLRSTLDAAPARAVQCEQQCAFEKQRASEAHERKRKLGEAVASPETRACASSWSQGDYPRDARERKCSMPDCRGTHRMHAPAMCAAGPVCGGCERRV